ncbi:MAG: hypothetical protein M1819_004454 [Sarea resinae]|nr:MAG: hypothetical protein M1819_004454 [Sarea resinae]
MQAANFPGAPQASLAQSSARPADAVNSQAMTEGDDTFRGHQRKRRRTSSLDDGNAEKRLRQALGLGQPPHEDHHAHSATFQSHPATAREDEQHATPQAEPVHMQESYPVDGPIHAPVPESASGLESRPGTEQAQSGESSQDPWAAAIAGLVDYQYRDQGSPDHDSGTGVSDSPDWLSFDASLHLKVQSLPILDNLATQILGSLAKKSYPELLSIVTEEDSESGQAYSTLKSLFDHTKKVYSQHDPFLSPYQLNLHEQSQLDTIRKTNLTTFVTSVFGSQDVGFYHLNEFFFDTFVPEGGRLLKSQGALFLDLKTQAYISAMSHGERSREEILEDLFPTDLEQWLLDRRPGAKQLAPSELDFVKRAQSRREHLLELSGDDKAIAALPDRYAWEDFLRDVSNYVSKNFNNVARRTHAGRERHSFQAPEYQAPVEDDQTQLPNEQETQVDDTTEDDVIQKAARAVQVALYGESHDQQIPQEAGQEHQYQQGQPSHQPEYNPYNGHSDSTHDLSQSLGDVPDIPYHTQTAPTQVLYERARQAATAKASPNNRRAGLPSQRRPWTTEEENALMAGLDRVKGPHWSQILAMFGAGGTVNEVLKDRNQVQLKDKARNLKLFFLKSGIEVPYYLQFVTGELKTRAPAQAAKHEARERARLMGEEDKAHIEGVMALVNGSSRQDSIDTTATPEAQVQSQAQTQESGTTPSYGDPQQPPQQLDAVHQLAHIADYEQRLEQSLRAAKEAEQAEEAELAQQVLQQAQQQVQQQVQQEQQQDPHGQQGQQVQPEHQEQQRQQGQQGQQEQQEQQGEQQGQEALSAH